MKFEDFKKQFDESFGKVTPKEFIQRMENLGYKFKDIVNNEACDAIDFKNWCDEYLEDNISIGWKELQKRVNLTNEQLYQEFLKTKK